MAKKLAKTSFGSSPKKGLEVEDIYKSEALKKFVKDPSEPAGIEAVNEIYPDLKADKVMEVLRDPRTQAYLKKTGVTAKELMDATRRNLPEGVDLNDMLGGLSFPEGFSWGGTDSEGGIDWGALGDKFSGLDFGEGFDWPSGFDWPEGMEWPEGWSFGEGFSLPECFKFSSSLKSNISMPEWAKIDGDTCKSIFGKAKEWYKEYNTDGDSDKGALAFGISKASGLISSKSPELDSVMNAAHKYGVSEKLIKLGSNEKIADWIAKDDKIPEKLKRKLFGDLAVDAALANNQSQLDDMLAHAGDLPPEKKDKLIQNILRGYKLPKGLKISGYANAAKELLAKLDKVNPKWNEYVRDGDTVGNLYYYTFASEFALLILGYSDETRNQAVMYKSLRVRVTDYKRIARLEYPFLTL